METWEVRARTVPQEKEKETKNEEVVGELGE